jgi:hypothetical protein
MRYAMPPLMSSCTTLTSHAPTAGVAVACFKGDTTPKQAMMYQSHTPCRTTISDAARAFTLGDHSCPLVRMPAYKSAAALKANCWHGNLRAVSCSGRPLSPTARLSTISERWFGTSRCEATSVAQVPVVLTSLVLGGN